MIDFSQLFDRSPNPYMVLDRALRFVAVNEAYLRVTGRTREELLGVCLFDAFPGNPDDPDDSNVRELRASLESAFDSGEAQSLGLIRYAIEVPRADGEVEFEERIWSAIHTPLPGPDGVVRHVLQYTVDVTELQRLKAELREARKVQALSVEQMETTVLERAQQMQLANQALEAQRRHLLRLFEEAPGFMAYMSGPDHVFELANHAYLRMVGRSDIVGKPLRDALPDIAGQGYFELLDEVYRSGEPFVGTGSSVEIDRGAGPERAYADFVFQPVFDAEGQVAGIIVQGYDITSQKLAQEELEQYHTQLEELVQARTRALERSRTALTQARKLEDIGKLTGGVAHDFNNVLQIIGANLQLMEAVDRLPPAAAMHARAAMQGVERGARLSSQLLSFARRQPLQPVVIDLAEHIASLHVLLRGTLGEAIELRLEVNPDSCPVEADRHQLDNALINLALNARDAMAGRGKLVVTVGRDVRDAAEEGLPAGDYGLLTIVDNGSGMSSDVLAQAFDPFFTTKDVGQGTGLGLSMVYGFVKQSGGHIAITSEPGAGTEVRIWLPCAEARPTPVVAAPDDVQGGNEVVLVVEDDAAVRESVVALVRTLGYRVFEAVGVEAALGELEGERRFDVLFTDLVMPGRVSGVELARRARVLQPGIAVLVTTGYSEAIAQQGRIDARTHLLAKPYSREELARKLREVLRPAAIPPRLPLRVLVVDDDIDSHGPMQSLLRLLGHQARCVATAVAAWSELEQHSWDVVLADLHLPGMSGFELIRRIRDRWPELRVIAVSGAAREELRAVDGADAALQKPYSAEQLRAVLGS